MENSRQKKSPKRTRHTVRPDNEQTALVDRGDVMSFDNSELHQSANVFHAGARTGEGIPLYSHRLVVHLWSFPTLLRIDMAGRRPGIGFGGHSSGPRCGRRLVVGGRHG